MMKHQQLTILLVILSLVGHAQNFTDTAIQKIDSFSANYPQEKVFVHTDRNFFLPGETIWFSAYVTHDGNPSYLSKVVYAEVADVSGKLVAKQMLPLKNGFAAGDIIITEKFSPGSYTLKAYTLWMLNFPDFMFSKTLLVHPGKVTTNLKSKALSEPGLLFFPEGGNVTTGVTNRVAFKATQPNGQPFAFSGSLIDDKGIVLSEVNSVHDGMGVFELNPQPGKEYFVTSPSFAPGKKIELPPAKDEGVSMQVNNENASRLFVQVLRSEKNKALYNEVTVLAQMNHEVVYSAKLNFDEQQNVAAIPKKNLPKGIMHITVFSKTGVPLLERLAFVSKTDSSVIAADVSGVKNEARSPNTIVLNLAGYKNLQASISIVNGQVEPANDDPDIYVNHLLASDLKGHIHNAAFYFKDNEPGTTKALDLLLMTHGWRRFKWDALLANQYPKLKHPVESGIGYSGRFVGAGQQPLAGQKVDFVTKAEDSTTVVSSVVLGKNGEFYIPDLHFRKGATVYYQVSNSLNKKISGTLLLDKFYFDSLTKSASTSTLGVVREVADSDQLNTIAGINKKDSLGQVLETVVIKTKKLSPTDSLTALYASDIYQVSDQTLVMDERVYINIWQFLERNVPGLTIGRNTLGQNTVFFNRYQNLEPFSTPSELLEHDPTTNIVFFLNEVPVSKDIVETIDPADLGIVKVYKGNTASSLGASRGAIAIYTRKDKPRRGMESSMEFFKKAGYAASREYYPVDYRFDASAVSKQARITLYWTPSIKINSSGKAVIKFFNDDVCKKFKLTVNGMDDNGRFVRLQKIIE